MIVPTVPRVAQIVREVWRPLTLLFLWDCIVTAAYYALPERYAQLEAEALPTLPLTLFGTALALFLGFRDNSAYARWWEGRQLWGLMVNASRNVARAALSFIPGDDAKAVDLRRSIVLRQIAYVHCLRCQLRKQDPSPDVRRFLSDPEAAEPLSRRNAANGLLDGNGERVAEALRFGMIDTIQQAQIERVFVDIANAQGGMERIKSTPLPMQYRFFPELFTRIFCLLLPIGLVSTLEWATPIGSTLAGLMFLAVLKIGDDLVDPFANTPHDLPLLALCTVIEIDLLEAIGLSSPDPAVPDANGVLW